MGRILLDPPPYLNPIYIYNLIGYLRRVWVGFYLTRLHTIIQNPHIRLFNRVKKKPSIPSSIWVGYRILHWIRRKLTSLLWSGGSLKKTKFLREFLQLFLCLLIYLIPFHFEWLEFLTCFCRFPFEIGNLRNHWYYCIRFNSNMSFCLFYLPLD